MGMIPIWDAEEKKIRKAKKLKRCFLLIGCIALLFLLLVSFYIWIYDGSKPVVFSPSINENRIKSVAEQFQPNIAEKQTEIEFRAGKLKALLVISAENCDPEQRLEEQYRNAGGNGVQYRKVSTVPETEMLLRDWNYTPLKKLFVGKGNPYAACYGKEAAKGKSNYRYVIEVTVKKGTGCYLMRAFCNRPNELDSLLEEFAKQIG